MQGSPKGASAHELLLGYSESSSLDYPFERNAIGPRNTLCLTG